MKNKVFGILTPIATLLVMVGVVYIVAFVNQSSDGWAALGALIMVFMLTGVILLVLLVVGVVLYFKNKSEYAIGLLYGLAGVFVVGLVVGVIGSIF